MVVEGEANPQVEIRTRIFFARERERRGKDFLGVSGLKRLLLDPPLETVRWL